MIERISLVRATVLWCAVVAFAAVASAATKTWDNGGGDGLWSTGANWLRDGVLMLPLSLALASALGPGGIVWANALANVIAGCVAGWLAWRYIVSLKRADARPAE